MREKIYVTYTCKNKECQKAFIDEDFFNNIDDVPLTTRYCPECVAKGFRNEKPKKAHENIYESNFKTFILEENITDDRDIKFLHKYYLKKIATRQENGDRVVSRNIFKEALEVLGYQDWKTLDK